MTDSGWPATVTIAAMAADETAYPLVFPVGHYCGSTAAGADQRHHEVRRGPEIVALADDMFTVWGLAHSTPDAPQDEPWTWDSIVRQAQRAGVADAADVLDDLVTEGLCVRVRSGAPQAKDFATSYQVHPTMLGLGNSAEHPELYEIGFLGAPLLQVSRGVFEVWRWAPAVRTLWEVCELYGEMERQHGVTDPDSINPEYVLTGFLDTLHGMLSAGAAYLDVAR